MKIGIVLGQISVGSRSLDFDHIWDSNRGLTGTDLASIMISLELVKLGHEVHLFTVFSGNKNWAGIKIHSIEERLNITSFFDSIISINEPNVFMGLNTTKPFRICWQFWNDFGYCNPGYETYVDKFLGASQQHAESLKKLTSCPEKWNYLNLGCVPEWYEDNRVPGRILWCSSAD